MADILELAAEAKVLRDAKVRVSETDAYQSTLATRYRFLHFMYAPPNDDQWPSDKSKRPGKIHITSNIVKPAVDIDARLQAKLPRITLAPMDLTQKERARAETVEKMTTAWLEAADWDVQMHRLTRPKCLYGKGVLKVFWNTEEKRPDFNVIERPENLRIGWGSSDFRVMDWALYEYSISPMEVMRRWPNLQVIPTEGQQPLQVIRLSGDHTDPLQQKQDTVRPFYSPSDYERKQVTIWDYWYKDADGDVYNCIIVQGSLHAVPPTPHTELLDLPYIVIPNDQEPGSPEGISTAAAVVDVQDELNRALAHLAQLVADEIDPSWQLTGENADSIPGGMVPRAGEIVPAGSGNQIQPINKAINTFPADQLIKALWDQFHKTTGLGEIAFGVPSSSQESGQALAIQIDAAMNRLEPKRALLYSGMKKLLIYWTVMVERLDPKISIDLPDGKTKKVGLAKLFKGYRRWKVVGPEITPKDIQSHTLNEINKLNAGVQSAHTTMDNLGIDTPEDEMKLIGEENSNLALNPGKVQQAVAVYAALQQIGVTQEQLQQMAAASAPGAASALAQDQTGANNAMAQAQRAQPTLGTPNNQAQQPATAAGSAAPPGQNLQGGPAQGIQQTTLVRSNPAGRATTLNQLALNRRL